jgi:ABC-type proline/glycine betaine transport system permease subunit
MLVIAIAIVGAVAAAIGLGCTIVHGVDLYREWVKRVTVFVS